MQESSVSTEKEGKQESWKKKVDDAKMQGNQQKVQQKQSEKQDSACFNTIGQAGMVVEDTHSFLDSTIATTVMGNKREEKKKRDAPAQRSE